MQKTVFDQNNFYLPSYGVEGVKKKNIIENLTLQVVIFLAKDTIDGIQNFNDLNNLYLPPSPPKKRKESKRVGKRVLYPPR